MKLKIEVDLVHEQAHNMIKVFLDPHPATPPEVGYGWAESMPARLRKVARIVNAFREAVKANKL